MGLLPSKGALLMSSSTFISLPLRAEIVTVLTVSERDHQRVNTSTLKQQIQYGSWAPKILETETNLVEAGYKTFVVDENWVGRRHRRRLYLETNNLEWLWANEVSRVTRTRFMIRNSTIEYLTRQEDE
jgi:hypothetical protein